MGMTLQSTLRLYFNEKELKSNYVLSLLKVVADQLPTAVVRIQLVLRWVHRTIHNYNAVYKYCTVPRPPLVPILKKTTSLAPA